MARLTRRPGLGGASPFLIFFVTLNLPDTALPPSLTILIEFCPGRKKNIRIFKRLKKVMANFSHKAENWQKKAADRPNEPSFARLLRSTWPINVLFHFHYIFVLILRKSLKILTFTNFLSSKSAFY